MFSSPAFCGTFKKKEVIDIFFALSFEKEEVHISGKLLKVVAVSFGLLCVLQVSLNVSLRLGYCELLCTGMTPWQKKKKMTQRSSFCSIIGWVHNGSSLYYISSVKKSWQKSRDDCWDRGADLMIIDNRAEQDFVETYQKRMWIGLSDAKTEGVWKWVDGSLLQDSRFVLDYYLTTSTLILVSGKGNKFKKQI
uniref:C-type lectin domain-containing protein n=1 Tax=Gouania willdenowi TaxID=441366 RepID=A0A8C5G9D7_GOUWI